MLCQAEEQILVAKDQFRRPALFICLAAGSSERLLPSLVSKAEGLLATK